MSILDEIFSGNINFPAIKESVGQLLLYDPANPMLFCSGLFLFLFAGFMFFYSFMRRRPVLRMVYTILFSVYFYYKTGGFYFMIMVVTSLCDFTFGLQMVRERMARYKKLFLIASLAVNLGMLAYFKYTNFFIGIANDIAGQDMFAFRNIFLPIGISFFVFQSLSYTIDIYRGVVKPLTNWLDYFFYVSFFPQLVAGPIVRARDFIPQIRQNPLRVTRDMFGQGLFFIMVGLLKKAVISDYISVNFVNRVFDNPALYSGFENLMGVYGYALQIYCDFSGYSDMAIGLALLMGFRFPLNFDSPYKAATITEFWRRWHISLSSWLRDYLYISLGGNRKGKTRTYINLFITMLLGGLWHGAAIRFVLWGAFHGILLAAHKMILSYLPDQKIFGTDMKRIWRIAGIIVTFNLVCLGWIFFRAPDMQTGFDILSQIFTNFDLRIIPEILLGYWHIFAMILFGYALHYIPVALQQKTQMRVIRNNILVNALIIVALVWIVMQLKSADVQPFIYFQF